MNWIEVNNILSTMRGKSMSFVIKNQIDMSDPQISVIVSVYNTEKYLHRCIDSILAQTYKDFELLLIDDGSTDSSGRICDNYADRDNRINVIHKHNEGSSKTRLVGLDHALGEYVYFADSDDWLDDNFIADMVTIEEQYCPDVILCDYYFNRDGHDILTCNKPSVLDPKTILNDALRNKIHAGLWNKFFKRSIFYDSRMSVPKCDYYEDMYILGAVMQITKNIFYTPHAYYHYRYVTTSLTNDTDPKKRLNMFKQVVGNMEELNSKYKIFQDKDVYEAVIHTINWNKYLVLSNVKDKKIIKEVMPYYKNTFCLKDVHSFDRFLYYISCRYDKNILYPFLRFKKSFL
jgi:glycosyltransferase involved in cell wall biosynthesis